MTPQAALAALRAEADPDAAARRQPPGRAALGVPRDRLEALARAWRAEIPSLDQRLALAAALWETGVLEARILAAKLLIQARIRDDAPVWARVRAWVRDIDGPAIADAVAEAGRRRLAAAPERLDEIEPWTRSPHPWTRRAALAFALPWSKGRHLSAADLARRERILVWAAACAGDGEPVVQTAVAAWLRALSRHDPDRVRAFLEAEGARLGPSARRAAAARLA